MQKRMINVLLICLMAIWFAGCGNQADTSTSKQTTTGILTSTHIMTAADLETRDNKSDHTVVVGDDEFGEWGDDPDPIVDDPDMIFPEETELVEMPDTMPEPVVTPTPTPVVTATETPIETPMVTPRTAETPAVSLAPMNGAGYRFQNFVLSQADNSNAAFSGEAALSALDMWRELISEPEKSMLKRYIGRDYLSYESTLSLKILNKIWVDDDLDVYNAGSISPYITPVNMRNPSATAVKNNWVSNNTNGYIPYTPSNFNSDTVMDLMSIIYFADTWEGGAKNYDTKSRIFFNADGSETRTVMLRDDGLTYWELDNATAYCMYFTNGCYMMVVLPNRGVDLQDVDITTLTSGGLASKTAHVRFYMPEFDTESSYVMKLRDFGVPTGQISGDKISGVPDGFSPVISQVARVSLNRFGVGDVTGSGTKAVGGNAYDDDYDIISMICDRPFLYYIGDSENQDIALFGVVNRVEGDNMPVLVEPEVTVNGM